MPKKINRQAASPAVFSVADRLHSTAIHLLRRVRKQDVASGEGPARLSALSVLVFGGAKTLGELAAAEQVKPPTMSRIIAGLARSKLVEITAQGKFVSQFQLDSGPGGGAFGVAVTSDNGVVRFAAVDDDTNTVHVWTLQEDTSAHPMSRF